MKIPHAEFVCLLLPTLSISGPLFAEPGATEVDNGHFEKFTDGRRVTCWHYRGWAWHAAEGAGVKNSRALIYENGDPAFDVRPSQWVEFSRGYRAYVDADIRIEGKLAGEGGAFVEAEWFDDKDVRLGGIATQPVAATSDGWLHLNALSDEAIPKEAAKCRVRFGVTKGCTGKVVFDNVRFARWHNPRLLDLTTSAPENRAKDGPMTVTAELDLTEVDPAIYKGLFVWRGSDGKTHTVPPTAMDARSAKLDLDVRDLAFGKSTVAFVLLKGKRNEVDARREIVFER